MAATNEQLVAPGMTAQQRYDSLAISRSTPLERAREAAKLTIPGLMPPEGSGDSTKLYTPFQSIGARGVNNLASKMLLALFPPGGSFFRLTMDDYVVEQLAEAAGAGADDARAEFEKALGKVERAVINRMEQVGSRLQLFEAIKQLLVSGNCLIQILPNGKLVLHKLNNYVVKRDMSGDVLEIVVKQTLSRMTLPPRAKLIVDAESPEEEQKDLPDDKSVDIYTRISRTARGSWTVHQEVMGKTIPGTEGTYPKDKSAWLPLRFTAIDGEDYGRGLVEEYIGDVKSLESLSKSIVTASAVAAKIIFMVNEAGVTSKAKIARAASGAVVDGDAKDVTVLALEKYNDFRVAKETADGIETRLQAAFLLNSSVQRNAERVTAEEIRFLASELEQTLGGVYSILSQELQRPLVIRIMAQMQKERSLPNLPEKAVRPQIVTGLEALGRGADLQRLDILVAGLNQNFGPEAVKEYINVGGYATRRGTALGMDTEGIVRSEAEVQAAREQQTRLALAQSLGPEAIKANAAAAPQAAQQAA